MLKMIKDNWLGVAGLLALCVGLLLPHGGLQNTINVLGIASLVLYAKLSKNQFFFYLEVVVLLGTILNICQVSGIIVGVAMLVASAVALAKVMQSPGNHEWPTAFGLLGLAGLALGYTTLNPLGYFIGGVGCLIYSLIGFSRGIKSALIFALLNLIYGGLALYGLLHAA